MLRENGTCPSVGIGPRRVPPEPVGQVVAGFVPVQPGIVYGGLVDRDGVPRPAQPFMVLRAATRDEWIAENPARATSQAAKVVTHFYLVSTD